MDTATTPMLLDLTATITFSVTTIVLAGAVLYLLWRLGQLTQDIRRLTAVLLPSPAIRASASALTAVPTGAAGAGASTTEDSAVATTGSILRSSMRIPVITPETGEPVAATPTDPSAVPLVAPSPVFISSTSTAEATDTLPMNGSNPSIPVVVLPPAA